RLGQAFAVGAKFRGTGQLRENTTSILHHGDIPRWRRKQPYQVLHAENRFVRANATAKALRNEAVQEQVRSKTAHVPRRRSHKSALERLTEQSTRRTPCK